MARCSEKVGGLEDSSGDASSCVLRAGAGPLKVITCYPVVLACAAGRTSWGRLAPRALHSFIVATAKFGEANLVVVSRTCKMYEH